MSGTIHSTRDPQRSTRLRRGMLVFLVLGLLATLAVAAVEWSLWRKLAGVQAQFANPRPEQFTAAVTAQRSIEEMNAALLRFQLSNDPAERDNFEAMLRKLKPIVAQGDKNVASAFAAYLFYTEPLRERSLGAVRKDSADRVQEQIDKASSLLREACTVWAREQQASLNALFATSARSAGAGRRLIEVSGILLVALLAGALILAYAPLRSRLREGEVMLERQEKLASLGTLATGIAHEIRNPLAAIKLRLFSLKKALPAPLASHEDLVVIKHQIDRLDEMVKDFLQFARPSDPTLMPISARELLQSVHALLQPQLKKRGVLLEAETADGLMLNGDKEQLEQVLVNLVQNAADSVERDGTVTLRARQGVSKVNRQSTPLVILEVSDTGRGIPPEVQERIFDPFFSTKDSGTGLGLPIAARIIEKHGGFIQYQSQLNRGTTFSIVLPRPESNVTTNSAH